MTYKISLKGCILPSLNGEYNPTTDSTKLPYICVNEKTNTRIQPFIIYCNETTINSKQHRFGIFVVPCIPKLFISQPCWVIAEIPFNNNNTKNNNNNNPIYYYYHEIDMTNKYVTQDVYNPKVLASNNNKCEEKENDRNYSWKPIAGLLSNPKESILIEIIQLSKNADHDQLNQNINNNNNNNNISSNTLDLVPIDETKEIILTKTEENFTENSQNLVNSLNSHNSDNSRDDNKNKHYFADVEDEKCTNIEMIGTNQIIRVTDDINELKREWDISELGPHDELECFLNCIGKVIGISDEDDDDNTIKIQWSNNDMNWLPAKACWITWNKTIDNYPYTMPKYYYDDNNTSSETETSLSSDIESNLSIDEQYTLAPIDEMNETNENSLNINNINNNNNNNNTIEEREETDAITNDESPAIIKTTNKRKKSKKSEKMNERLDRNNDLELLSELV